MPQKPAKIDLNRLNQQQAATLIGKTPSWLRENADAPRNADGSYSGPAVVAWFVAQQPKPRRVSEQAERLRKLQADRLQMRLEIEAGEIVSYELSQLLFTTLVNILSNRADGFCEDCKAEFALGLSEWREVNQRERAKWVRGMGANGR